VRNYQLEMDRLINQAHGDAAAPLAAARLLAWLRREDPDLLAGWLQQRAAVVLADTIRNHREAA
jgi:hypothetical protein